MYKLYINYIQNIYLIKNNILRIEILKSEKVKKE